MLTCEPDGGFGEAFRRLALTVDVEVAAGAELRQQAEPLRRVDASVERGQERMVQHLQNFPLGPRATFFASARQLLLVHHFRRVEATVRFGCFQFGEMDGADVAGAESGDEAEVREGELAGRVLGADPVDGGAARVGGRRVVFGGRGGAE